MIYWHKIGYAKRVYLDSEQYVQAEKVVKLKNFMVKKYEKACRTAEV